MVLSSTDAAVVPSVCKADRSMRRRESQTRAFFKDLRGMTHVQ